MMKTWINKEVERDPAFGRAFAEEGLVIDATEGLAGLLKMTAISPSVLAEKLGTSRAYVSQLLNGGQNLTLRTLARVAYVMGFKVGLSFRPLAVERMQYRRSLRVCEPALPESVIETPAIEAPGGGQLSGEGVCDAVAC